ncbi:MAG TPA: hypothetical protein VJZ01_11150 [Lachnospiraceae bacterium]|nr:hypothetical protein [Lachnospiraceae bacterium]
MTDSEKLDVILGKMDSLDNKVDMLDNKVDSLGNKVNSLDNKVDSLDNKVDSLDNKVDFLESEVKQLKRQNIKSTAELKAMDSLIFDEVERVHEILEKHVNDTSVHMTVLA